jgi:hypothetical protein
VYTNDVTTLPQPFIRKRFSGIVLLCVIFLCPMFTGSYLYSQTWKFVKEKDGIKVFTRQELGSSLKSFKGVADLTTNVAKVYALIGHVSSNDNWDKNIRELRVLSSQKDKSFSYYLIYSIPWPLHDRDLCVEAKITRDTGTGEVVIFAQSRPQLVPENENYVRIRNYWQKWIIQPLDKDHIRLTLEGYADPAGSIPGWLYNMVITDTPLNMIHDIRERVK